MRPGRPRSRKLRQPVPRWHPGPGIASKPPQLKQLRRLLLLGLDDGLACSPDRDHSVSDRESSMRRLTSLGPLHPRPMPGKQGKRGRPSATLDVGVELALMKSSVAGYQPLMNSVIRRCPLLNITKHNRHTPVTERSVALLAPHQPKCPHSAGGSQRPRFSARRYESTTGVSTVGPRSFGSQAAKLARGRIIND